MSMLKRLVIVAVFILCIISASVVSAQGLEYSAIEFLSSTGTKLTQIPTVGETVTARATIKNSGSTQNASLIIGEFENGVLKTASADSKLIQGGTEMTLLCSLTVKSSLSKITATGFTSFMVYTPVINTAHLLSEETGLESITVDGVPIEDYSDGVNDYTILSEKYVKLDAVAKDGSSSVSISDYTVPGNAVITVKPQIGEERIINILILENEDDSHMLQGIKYMIGDKEYEVANFSKKQTSYKVNLPENTYLLTLRPETIVDSSLVTCLVTDQYVASNTFGPNLIKYGEFSDTPTTSFKTARQSVDGVIPVKFGKVSTTITVKSGTGTTSYIVDFESTQPTLTELNYKGAAADARKPCFVSGGGLLNDNASIAMSDRRWSFANISKKLIGASYFTAPVDNKGSGYWWNDNTTGEYYNFTADTSGTAYLLSVKSVTNSEYEADGWTRVSSNIEPAMPAGISQWHFAAKNWNDYNESIYAANITQWANDTYRVNPEYLYATNSDAITGANKSYTEFYLMVKHFKAGENVKIYHTGVKGSYGVFTVAIRWDKGDYPYKEPEPDPEPEITDENMKLLFDYQNNTFKNIYDKESLIWKDLSGYGNDLKISIDENVYWSDEGLQVMTGEVNASDKLMIDDSVSQILNAETYSIMFEITDCEAEDGKEFPIFSSTDSNLRLYKPQATDAVRFKIPGANISSRQASAPIGDISGSVNVITVDKTGEQSVVKWYINGVVVSEKSFTKNTTVISDVILGGSLVNDGGKVVYKKIAVYDKILSEEEINNLH